jgi:hypothetical protein
MDVLILAGIILVLIVVVLVQNAQLGRLHRAQQVEAAKPKVIKISQPTAEELESRLKAAYETQIASSVQVFGQDLKATSVKLG